MTFKAPENLLRVLIVEDNPADAELVDEYLAELSDFELESESVATSSECLKRLEESAPDLLLLDLNLPDSSGLDTLSGIAEGAGSLPIVVLTGGHRRALEIEALESGADEFIEKRDLDESTLRRAVDHAIQRHRIRRELDVTRRAVDAAQEGIVIADARAGDDPLIYANAGFVEMTGYELDEVLGRNCRFLQCADTDEVKVDRIHRALEDEEPVTVELLNARKDGERFWNQLSITPVHSESGELTHFIGVQKDVTRRVEAEREVSRKQQELKQYETIVENTTDAVMIKDEAGRYQLVNRAFADIVDRPKSQIVGKTDADIFGEEVGRDIWEREREVLEGQAPQTYEEQVPINGEIRIFLTTRIPRPDSGGAVGGTIGVCRDISQQKALQEDLEHQALYDGLTDLPNRTLFRDRITQAVERARRRSELFGIAFVDLDDFKAANDSYGHAFGDSLLCRVADRLVEHVRDEDTVARFGGDEFILLFEQVDDRADLEVIGKRLARVFERPFGVSGEMVRLNASIGFALPFDESFEEQCDETLVDRLTRTADRAMYRAKTMAGTTWRIFATTDQWASSRRLQREERIRRGVRDGEFVPYYQPICRLSDDEIVAFEALARWEHAERGLVSPAEFIPLAERSALICDIGEALLERACREFESLDLRADRQRDLTLYINLSPRQVEREASVERLMEMASAHAGGRFDVWFEVTETDLLERDRHVAQMRKQGFPILVDDFGTGFSSLSRLKEMPVDSLKLDMQFVHGALQNSADRAIAETIATLGDKLDIPVIAEGVEDQSQLEFVREIGCYAAQGYYLARPMPIADVEDLLRDDERLGGLGH